jgi:hypothetical protein
MSITKFSATAAITTVLVNADADGGNNSTRELTSQFSSQIRKEVKPLLEVVARCAEENKGKTGAAMYPPEARAALDRLTALKVGIYTTNLDPTLAPCPTKNSPSPHPPSPQSPPTPSLALSLPPPSPPPHT